MNKVLIIVPFYNTENYHERCIKIIIDQSYVNIEINLITKKSIRINNTGSLKLFLSRKSLSIYAHRTYLYCKTKLALGVKE
jgi:hypothetical protein